MQTKTKAFLFSLFFFFLVEMDSHGQLITLQFGTVSNWTGAHFWNLQVCACVRERERFDSDVFFCFGQGRIRSTNDDDDLLSLSSPVSLTPSVSLSPTHGALPRSWIPSHQSSGRAPRPCRPGSRRGLLPLRRASALRRNVIIRLFLFFLDLLVHAPPPLL